MSDETAATDAARRVLGALLLDADVSAAHALEGGALEVTRRGRRERISATLGDELFASLRALGAAERALVLDVDGHRLHAAPTTAGKLLAYLEKRAPLDVELGALVEEGMVPRDVAPDILALARSGHGLVVVGAPRAGARRLAIAVARDVAAAATVMALDDDAQAPWLLPAPAVDGGVLARARAAAALGAEAVLALDLSLDGARALARADLPVAFLVVVAAPGAAALHAAFKRGEGGLDADALATQLCVVGRGPEGRPVLVEHHAPSFVGSAPPAPVAAAPVVAERPRRVEPAAVLPPASELPPLPPLGAGPPAAWASSDVDDDPGWELGGGEQAPARRPAPSGFDDVMAEVKARPTFTPRPPPLHPQARKLRGDPLGGLTLEPPGGDVADDDEHEEEAEDEREDER